MRLDLMTWEEVAAYLTGSNGAILPVGSTEQHGPIGLIGTDALCAAAVAERAGAVAGAVVLPALAYTPAPFNMAFPGTVSLSEGTFCAVVAEIMQALATHGFGRLYILNGHGANLAPLRELIPAAPLAVRLRSWWEFPRTDALRRELYGDWEGMHATPSEVAITQALHRRVARAPSGARAARCGLSRGAFWRPARPAGGAPRALSRRPGGVVVRACPARSRRPTPVPRRRGGRGRLRRLPRRRTRPGRGATSSIARGRP